MPVETNVVGRADKGSSTPSIFTDLSPLKNPIIAYPFKNSPLSTKMGDTAAAINAPSVFSTACKRDYHRHKRNKTRQYLSHG